VEKRLNDLEKKVERLLKEIENLRRERSRSGEKKPDQPQKPM
jgi:molecular chaperone GrpE (heat shock protein)